MKGGDGGSGEDCFDGGCRRSSFACGRPFDGGVRRSQKEHRACILPFRFMAFLLFVFLVAIFYFSPLNPFLSSSPRSSCPTAAAAVKVARSALPTSSPANGITGVVQLSSSHFAPEAAEAKLEVDYEKEATGLQHIVFGIAASAKLWDKRKDYIKLWWRPGRTRGFVWFDQSVNASEESDQLPELKVSGDTSRFPYSHPKGHRSAIRISRIVTETFRFDLPGVRWFVMGDDDTVFFPDNLVAVLARFDHRQPYYIGSVSESHLQNVYLSYNMAYGGGGFAISRPLAAALAEFQDRCLKRYPGLYGSDERIQACMAELGVPLTRHPGFHQSDIHGNFLGMLASHPVAPLVSLHHVDEVSPIFPDTPSRVAALRRLFEGPVRVDSAAVAQQSICYDVEAGKGRHWTVSVAWGFAVLVVRGVLSPREMEMPARTFLNWYRRADYTAYSFNTRAWTRSPCQKPFVYFFSGDGYDADNRTTLTYYNLHKEDHPACRWNMPAPSDFVDQIIVYKEPDPDLWSRAPRRKCCRVLSSPEKGDKEKNMVIDVGMCRDREISEP